MCLRLKVHWTMTAVSVTLWGPLFSAWWLWFRSWKLCLLQQLFLWAAWKTGFLCTRLGAWMWNAGAEVFKAFIDVQTKREMKCLNEIWKLPAEKVVRSWFCTCSWLYLLAGWCCCQRKFGATSAECCEKGMPVLLLPPSSGCACTSPRACGYPCWKWVWGVQERTSLGHRCIVSACFWPCGPSDSGFILRPVWADELLSTGRKRSGRIQVQRKAVERRWKSLANIMEVFVLFPKEGKRNPYPLISYFVLHQNQKIFSICFNYLQALTLPLKSIFAMTTLGLMVSSARRNS